MIFSDACNVKDNTEYQAWLAVNSGPIVQVPYSLTLHVEVETIHDLYN